MGVWACAHGYRGQKQVSDAVQPAVISYPVWALGAGLVGSLKEQQVLLNTASLPAR